MTNSTNSTFPESAKAAVSFESAARLSPYFSRRRDPAELPSATLRDEREAFFSNFRPILETWASRVSGKFVFERFGFGTSDNFSLGDDFFSSSDVAAEAVLFENDAFARFLVVAPISTFQIIFDALLGVDVATVCGDSTLWRDVEKESRGRLRTTALERRTLETFFAKYSGVVPDVDFAPNDAVLPRPNGENASIFSRSSDGENAETNGIDKTNGAVVDSVPSTWRFLATRTFSVDALRELNDEFYYWERRALVFSSRRFPWAIVFPISSLARASEFVESGTNKSASPASGVANDAIITKTFGKGDATDSKAVASADAAFFSRLDDAFASNESTERRTAELSVEIVGATTRLDVWRTLKPGDVLPTNASTDALFVASVDGEPRFLGLPGLFRGAPAVQIKRILPAKEPNARTEET